MKNIIVVFIVSFLFFGCCNTNQRVLDAKPIFNITNTQMKKTIHIIKQED
jgi:hypothetical protein